MRSKIKTYNTENFRNEYIVDNSKLNLLFNKSLKDFFAIKLEDVIPDAKLPILPSRENCHSIIFVTEGSYKTKIGFQEYEIKPSQALIIQAGAVFSVEHINKSLKGFTCHFHPNTLIGKFGNRSLISEFEFLNAGSHPIIDIKESSKSAILNIFKRLATEFKNDTNPNIIHTYLYTLLTELKILVGESNSVKPGASYQITTQFRTLVHLKVKENLKVADFARIMNISPNHLNKSVKSITAKSASEIIDEIKLIEIKYLLYQSTLSVSEISYEMGYLDPSYFTRFFKKRENLSPTEFRELIEKS